MLFGAQKHTKQSYRLPVLKAPTIHIWLAWYKQMPISGSYDGVHLNVVGNDCLLNSVRCAVISEFQTPDNTSARCGTDFKLLKL